MSHLGPRLSTLLVAAMLVAGCGGSSGPGAVVSPTGSPSLEVTIVHSREVPPLHPSVDDYPETDLELSPPQGDASHRLAVKVADTPARHRHGLMEVEDLPPGTGMWFVFDEDREGGFWMKNTLVPLDIAYVAADGEIRDVLHMEPCVEDPCPVYEPDHPYRTTLEVPAGWFGDVGVSEGWTLTEVS